MPRSLSREIATFNRERGYGPEISKFFDQLGGQCGQGYLVIEGAKPHKPEIPAYRYIPLCGLHRSGLDGYEMGSPALTHTPPRVSADTKLSVSLENTERLHAMLQDYLDNAPKVPEGMRVLTAEYRAQVDDALTPLMTLAGEKAITNEAAFDAFKKLRGVLHGCPVKSGASQTEEERLANTVKSEYRKFAADFAEAGMVAFSVPSRQTSNHRHFQLSREINSKAAEAQHDAREGTYSFARYLVSALQADSTPWNSVNFVTALYKLRELDQGWMKRSFAPDLCELVVRRLHTIANKEVFDSRALANLAKIAPGLIDAVGRRVPKSPQLEKMLFNSLSKAVEYLEQKPDERFADRSFLYPMREISSRFLTTEGSSALCSYIAKLNHLFSQMSYRNHLPTVAATFYAMNGISSWALSPDTDSKLAVMLGNLNDRLSKNVASMETIAAGSIIYGLKGLDIPNLSANARLEVCRTIRLVAEGIEKMPRGASLNHQAVSSIIHGLTIALSSTDISVVNATRTLLNNVRERLPYDAGQLDQIGALAGALVTLRPHLSDHTQLCKDLFRAITVPSQGNLTFSRGNDKDHIAWQTLQQAYALFGATMPPTLTPFITALKETVENSRKPNLSEQRIASYVREYPDMQLLHAPFIDGFETDLIIRVGHRIINIEVDGGFHNEPAKRIADKQRDTFLREKMAKANFDILRVPSNCSKETLFKDLDRVLSPDHPASA